ncbi:MAG: glycosyltransferase family 4 protein [Egibacteraceae bacterium]
MTRTLWVTTDFPPRPGGIEQYLANLLANQRSQDVRVLTANWPGAEAHDRGLPYRVERIGQRPLLPTPRLARTVRHAAEEHGAEVVLLGPAWPLGEMAGEVRRPTVALSYGHEAGMTRVGLGALVRRLGKASAVTVLSDFTRRALASHLAARTRLELVPPGVDVEAFHPGVDGSPVRARHGVAADQPLVACISRLVPRKGQDVLVEMWPEVKAAVPGAHLLIVGTGPLHERLRKRVGALGLRRDVTLTGAVGWDELPEYHAAADVFAMPCRTRLGGLDVEGLGIVYLEAAGCGVPVVAGDSGGAPEALIDGETGYVVDGREPTAIKRAIVELLRDGGKRVAMGKAGRDFVEQRWDWRVVVHMLDNLLTELSDS